MTPSRKPSSADAYIRVSRRAGREGESFISPEVQRKRIEAWAKAHDVKILEWWEEIDASGAKRDRPLFQQALERCERGETGGIVVAKLDRFARSAIAPHTIASETAQNTTTAIHLRRCQISRTSSGRRPESRPAESVTPPSVRPPCRTIGMVRRLPERGRPLPVVGYGRLAGDGQQPPATDDWPFIYLQQPGLPSIYLAGLATVLVIAVALLLLLIFLMLL